MLVVKEASIDFVPVRNHSEDFDRSAVAPWLEVFAGLGNVLDDNLRNDGRRVGATSPRKRPGLVVSDSNELAGRRNPRESRRTNLWVLPVLGMVKLLARVSCDWPRRMPPHS